MFMAWSLFDFREIHAFVRQICKPVERFLQTDVSRSAIGINKVLR